VLLKTARIVDWNLHFLSVRPQETPVVWRHLVCASIIASASVKSACTRDTILLFTRRKILGRTVKSKLTLHWPKIKAPSFIPSFRAALEVCDFY
jgi:hypothetical protein